MPWLKEVNSSIDQCSMMITLVSSIESLHCRPNTDNFYSKNRLKYRLLFWILNIQTKILISNCQDIFCHFFKKVSSTERKFFTNQVVNTVTGRYSKVGGRKPKCKALVTRVPTFQFRKFRSKFRPSFNHNTRQSQTSLETKSTLRIIENTYEIFIT